MAHFTKQHVTIVNFLCSSVLKRQKEAGTGHLNVNNNNINDESKYGYFCLSETHLKEVNVPLHLIGFWRWRWGKVGFLPVGHLPRLWL